LTAARVRPAACFDRLRQRHEAAAQRDHERDRQLGDGLAVHAGRPPQGDTIPARGRQIDHVEADAVLADDAQLRDRREDRGVQDLQAGDRALVSTQQRDEVVVAHQGQPGFVEGDMWVTSQELAPQRWILRERV
jgi:hypothetical protein